MTLHIRLYQPSDTETLRTILVDGFDGVSIDQNSERRLGHVGSHDWRWRKGRHLDDDIRRDSQGIFVAVIDGDDSVSLDVLAPMLAVVRSGDATMAVGRRRPIRRCVWPWHARFGTKLLATWLRRSSGLAIHDLAPVRVSPRTELLGLGVQDRRFGYPLELMRKAAVADWTVREFDVDRGCEEVSLGRNE